jgi:uncharacterized membrane protein YhiD involved in acid resistance
MDDIAQLFQFNITLDRIFYNSIVALICGFFILLLYRVTYNGPSYSRSFANSLVILTMITALVIMIIGNNLARAFGLVGAMSIIRFRTAIKDTQDIVFIFFSLSVGMAAGAGLHGIAIVGSGLVGVVTYLLSLGRGAALKRREFLLQFSLNGNANEESPAYLPVMKKYCKTHKLINMKSIQDGTTLELSFYVGLKDQDKGTQFLRELEKTPGIGRVNLFFDEETY